MDAAYVEVSSRRVSRERPRRGPLASRPSACWAAVGANLPGDRARRPNDGLTHLGRLTVNLMRPAPIGECRVEVATDYVGRNTGHYSGRLIAQRQGMRALHRAHAARGRRCPSPPERQAIRRRRPKPPDQCPVVTYTLRRRDARLRSTWWKIGRRGTLLQWTLRRLVSHEPSAYPGRSAERLRARGGCGETRATALARRWTSPNISSSTATLTINLFRRPEGEWICLESRSLFGGNGCGLAESALYDERGMIGRATQSLTVRPR